MKDKLSIVVVYGSVRTERKGIRVAKYVVEKVKEAGHDVIFIDPIEYKLPLLDKRLSDYEKGEKIPKVLTQLAEIFTKTDGIIIVSGEYNHSIPPALTNLMDHFEEEYEFKPSGIVTYSSGDFGGVRAAMQLRIFLNRLGCPTIPSMMPVPKIKEKFDEKGNAIDKSFDKRIKNFLSEFEWYALAMRAQREKGIPKFE